MKNKRTNQQTLTTKTLLALTLFGFTSVANADAIADLIESKESLSTSSLPVNTSESSNILSNTELGSAEPEDAIEGEAVFDSKAFHISYAKAPNIKKRHIDILHASEQTGSEAGKKILQTVRSMALDNKEIIKGACWDYLNAAFNRAGVGRDTVFKGAYPKGPFVNPSEIQAGDWLYYVNHSYRDIEHSGLFVGWVDRAENKALILSYAGGNRNEPARYKVYDISHTYNIMRPTL